MGMNKTNRHNNRVTFVYSLEQFCIQPRVRHPHKDFTLVVSYHLLWIDGHKERNMTFWTSSDDNEETCSWIWAIVVQLKLKSVGMPF